jgi:glutaminase
MPLQTRGRSLNSNDFLKADIQKILLDLHKKYISETAGKMADYIPELAKANPQHFGIAVVTCDGKVFTAGACGKNFTLQSASKPFVYGLALETIGREKMLSKVGVEPTGEAFNSIIELEKESHRPYNPMINSGAIAVSSFIDGKNADERIQKILKLFSEFAGRNLTVDENVFQSEKKTAHRNRAIAHLLKHFGIIEDDNIDESLDLYFKQCSILVNTVDLAMMAATLSNGGVHPVSKKQIFQKETAKDILSLMFTCGMYDTAGKWAYTVGLPAKSGVSGGLFASLPGILGVAVYSPLIDQHGHSVRAVKLFEELSAQFSLSIFSSGVN